jgi:para-nitrobenzyl esterase
VLPACPNDDPTANPSLSSTDYANAIHAEFDSLGAGFGNAILNLYPTSNILDLPVWQLVAVDSDLTVGASCSYREVSRAAAGANGKPVWRYIYTHTYERNDPNVTPYRAFHAAELPFVFGNPSFADPGTYTPTFAERRLSFQMIGYWTRFAATGNPNGSDATAWPPYDATDAMLQIDDTSTEINGENSYRKAQCDFYDANAAALSTVQ